MHDRGGDRVVTGGGFDRDRGGDRAPVASIATAARGHPPRRRSYARWIAPPRRRGRPDRAPGGGQFDRDRGRRPDGGARGPRPDGRPAPQGPLTAKELEEVAARARRPPIERPESAEVTPEAMARPGDPENLMAQLDFHVRVDQGRRNEPPQRVGEGPPRRNRLGRSWGAGRAPVRPAAPREPAVCPRRSASG